MFMGFDENEGDDDIREEFLCPFCSEYFDIVGLCCHIDEEHPVEAKNGVCTLYSITAFIFHYLVVAQLGFSICCLTCFVI